MSVVGCRCTLNLGLFTDDGQYVYIWVGKKQRDPVTKQLARADAKGVLAYLKHGHYGHELVPDVELLMAMPQCRTIPPMALASLRDMRSAGMAVKDIYNALHVSSHQYAVVDNIRGSNLAGGIAGFFDLP